MSTLLSLRPAAGLIGAALTLASTGLGAATMALEEVVVTAQKRSESAQDTPISMAAFSNSALERQGITNLTDLKDKVPNFQLTPHPNSATTTRLFMRGIGNNDDQITQDPSVAMYVDGVYVARTQGMAMEIADIERIEVLRGPQGSLYGRNATGGAINFLTEAPVIGDWGFQQDFSFGNRDLFRSRTSVNIPLGDSAAAEVSYLTHQKDGFVDNAGTGEDRFGDLDREAARAALLWFPTDRLEVRYTYDRSVIEDTPAYIDAVPFHPREGDRPSTGSPFVRDLQANDVLAQGHNLTLTWELADNLTFKSITGYRQLENENYQDYNTGVFGPFPIFITQWDQDQDQFTQEFQLVGDVFDGRVEYVAGLYYFDESADSVDQSLVFNRPLDLNGDGSTDVISDITSNRQVTIDNSAYAVFGQASWTPPVLEDRLKLTLGLRWSRDEREATLRETAELEAIGVTTPPESGAGDNDFTDVSPSLIVAYDVTYDINVYAKVVQGYKTGGFNIRASSVEKFEEGFDQETVTSYEAGIKSQFWDNRVRVNAAVFRADYEDIQVNLQSDPNDPSRTDVLNAGEAVIEGVELDVTAALAPGLTASISYGYLSADYEEIIDATGRDVSDSFYFVEVPDHSYNVDLEYMFPRLPFGELTANIGYSWQDERISSSTDKRYIIDDYGLLNARLALRGVMVGGGELRLALWGRNIQGEEYYLTHFNAGAPSAFYGEPRSYGIDVTYEY